MEFEKAMQAAAAYLTFTPRFMDPKQPQGLSAIRLQRSPRSRSMRCALAMVASGITWSKQSHF